MFTWRKRKKKKIQNIKTENGVKKETIDTLHMYIVYAPESVNTIIQSPEA